MCNKDLAKNQTFVDLILRKKLKISEKFNTIQLNKMFFLLLGLIFSGSYCFICEEFGDDFLKLARSGASYPRVFNATMGWCSEFREPIVPLCRSYMSKNLKTMYYVAKGYPLCDKECFCEKIGFC